MKKRIAALILIFLMICSVVLTSCNNNEEIEQEEVRRALTITLYCITDQETTPEAIQRVEKAINDITKKRLSTQIKLRFYTEDKYDEVIDNLVADIALEEKAKADAASESAAAAKESRRRAAIDKLIAADKAEVTTKKLIIWSTETEGDDDDEEEETYETEKNIFNEDVEKYPEASDTQLDIFLICGTENLNKYVTEEPYASDDESFLVSMDEDLSLSAKAIKQYVNETVLLAGKVGNSQYAIPTNKRMAGDSTYLVLDRALMKKYGFKEDDIRLLTSAKFTSYLDQIKQNEPDVVPFKSAPSAPGIVSLFEGESIFGTYVSNTAVTGFKAVPKNLLSAYQFTDHFIYMEAFKRNGYIPETVDENARWGAAVVTASEEEIAEQYDESKYVVKLLSKGMATTETIGEYMFGISKYTRDPKRCMEIITMITTNSEIRNLLQYGVYGYNYRIDPDTNKVERLNHEYMMNIFATGNTFIAYPEEDMDLDVWEKAKSANKNAIVSPYLGFLFEKEKNADLIEKMKQLSNSLLEQIKAFKVEDERLAKIDKLQKTKDDYMNDVEKYLNDLNAIKDKAEEYLAKIADAENELVPYTEALSAAKAAVAPYDKEIKQLNDQITSLKKLIDNEKKVKPTESNPNLAPDQEKIDGWQKQIEDNELEIRAQRGYSYELRKELDKAQAEYDAKNKALTDLQAEYKAIKLLDEEGKETEIALSTAYNARKSNSESFQKQADDTQKAIDALIVPEQSELDSRYAALEATISEYTEKLNAVNKEISDLNVESKPYNDAIKQAGLDLEAAKEKVKETLEAYSEFRKASAVALSYVEDKEAEVATAEGKVAAKEKEIAERKDDSKLEKLTGELETLKENLNKLNEELAGLKADYEKTFDNGKAEKAAYDAALADQAAKQKAYEDASDAEIFKTIAEKNAEASEYNQTVKKATSELNNFTRTTTECYDAIAKSLYEEYFKSIVTDLEKNNPDYQQFMNIGEEQAENENGIVYIYNEWYSATYGE
ncbi:MAG: hypothetical protein J5585_05155 [Clostridia bacterium]|nr:hypothetical protein [Clostridia bacterium]